MSRHAHAAHDQSLAPSSARTTLHVGGLHYASEKNVVEQVLGRRPGVLEVEANPVAQTATVEYDPTRTSVEELDALGRGVRLPLCRPLGARPRL